MEITQANVDTRTNVFRGKRSKRQRVDEEMDRKSLSPSYSDSDDLEEDEYIANCLLLLSQNGHTKSSGNNNECHNAPTDFKFTSKKYLGDGKSGKYVYECKTCGKLFHSFQALGGHRASHKKTKNIYSVEITQHDESWDDEDVSYLNPIPLLMSHKNIINRKSKTHQCGHCEAEFTSGQALGGHMRKHRSFLQAINYVNAPLNTSGLAQNGQQTVDQTLDLTLKLDLNLPAVDEEILKRNRIT